MGVKLIADVGEQVKIIKGEYPDLVGKTGEILVIHAYGTMDNFQHLYEPAYEVLTSDGKVQVRLNSEDIEPI
jgi:hypothetical protein